jgi:hypothetical protein
MAMQFIIKADYIKTMAVLQMTDQMYLDDIQSNFLVNNGYFYNF